MPRQYLNNTDNITTRHEYVTNPGSPLAPPMQMTVSLFTDAEGVEHSVSLDSGNRPYYETPDPPLDLSETEEAPEVGEASTQTEEVPLVETGAELPQDNTTPVVETVPEVAPETVPEVAPEIVPETVPETVPEVVPEVAPETAPEVAPETTPEVAAEGEPVVEDPGDVEPAQETAPQVESGETLNVVSGDPTDAFDDAPVADVPVTTSRRRNRS